MPDDLGAVRPGWLSRLRERGRARRERRADRRARRRGAFGDVDSGVRRAESGNFDSGGFFTKNTTPKP